MWPQRSYEECEAYFSPFEFSPKLKMKGVEEHVLRRYEVYHNPQSRHNTLYVGGAVWCVKWVPMFEESDRQYFLTVSHSRGEESVFMRGADTSGNLARGCVALWTCDCEGDNIEACYSICHDWGFVPQVEFCPSRSSTENRLCLLAVTSQVSSIIIDSKVDVPKRLA